ncbi:hypothetical protein F4775DRAFT_599074 [Biscogniauxia sp. FL1348]|nr:hypothetical protein F4775DRAFT_599074 [Biscogniauxia sp. FL1348]
MSQFVSDSPSSPPLRLSKHMVSFLRLSTECRRHIMETVPDWRERLRKADDADEEADDADEEAAARNYVSPEGPSYTSTPSSLQRSSSSSSSDVFMDDDDCPTLHNNHPQNQVSLAEYAARVYGGRGGAQRVFLRRLEPQRTPPMSPTPSRPSQPQSQPQSRTPSPTSQVPGRPPISLDELKTHMDQLQRAIMRTFGTSYNGDETGGGGGGGGGGVYGDPGPCPTSNFPWSWSSFMSDLEATDEPDCLPALAPYSPQPPHTPPRPPRSPFKSTALATIPEDDHENIWRSINGWMTEEEALQEAILSSLWGESRPSSDMDDEYEDDDDDTEMMKG